jgi:N-carbamoylputrescine amidase
MSEKFKVAAVQVATTDDRERNLARAWDMAELAAENGASILCYPELFHLPWFPATIDKKAFELAEPLTGPTVVAARETAKKLKVQMVFTLFEQAENDRFFNTALVINPEGEIDGLYRKMHIPQHPGWEEKTYFSPGDRGFVTFETNGLTFGVQICWDNFFPEGSRLLALSGAKLIFAPTGNSTSNEDLWRQSICNNAFVNGCYVVRVNRLSPEDEGPFSGGSFCAAPTGDLLEDPMGQIEGVGLYTIEPKALDFVRREWPFLRDRRPGQYEKLAESEQSKDDSET